jgi:hypothetical protein
MKASCLLTAIRGLSTLVAFAYPTERSRKVRSKMNAEAKYEGID